MKGTKQPAILFPEKLANCIFSIEKDGCLNNKTFFVVICTILYFLIVIKCHSKQNIYENPPPNAQSLLKNNLYFSSINFMFYCHTPTTSLFKSNLDSHLKYKTFHVVIIIGYQTVNMSLRIMIIYLSSFQTFK
jgi:hypothetical protein